MQKLQKYGSTELIMDRNVQCETTLGSTLQYLLVHVSDLVATTAFLFLSQT